MNLVTIICILQITTNLLIGLFMSVVVQSTAKIYTGVYNANTQPLYCSLNLLRVSVSCRYGLLKLPNTLICPATEIVSGELCNSIVPRTQSF